MKQLGLILAVLVPAMFVVVGKLGEGLGFWHVRSAIIGLGAVATVMFAASLTKLFLKGAKERRIDTLLTALVWLTAAVFAVSNV